MKTILSILLFFTITLVISQTKEAHYTTSQPEQNVLYYPYNNIIELSFPAGIDSLYFKHSKNITVKQLDSVHVKINVNNVKYEEEFTVRGIKNNQDFLISTSLFRVFEFEQTHLSRCEKRIFHLPSVGALVGWDLKLQRLPNVVSVFHSCPTRPRLMCLQTLKPSDVGSIWGFRRSEAWLVLIDLPLFGF